MTQTPTEKLVDQMTGMYYRRDNGHTNGRNAASTDATLVKRWGLLREALEAGGYEELDASSTLARKYAKLERRHLLGAAA